MTIEWSARALRHMASIHAWLLEQNPDVAVQTLERISLAVERLPSFPGLGRPGRVPESRELVVPSTRYVVPYTVRGDRVVVLAVLHHSQRWPPA